MSVDTVKDVIQQNKKNNFPEKLVGVEESTSSMAGVVDYQNSAELESLTRFEDKPEKRKGKRKGGKKPNRKGGARPFNKNRKSGNDRQQNAGTNRPSNKRN